MQQLSSIIFPSYVRMSVLYYRIGSGYKLLPSRIGIFRVWNCISDLIVMKFGRQIVIIYDMNHEKFHGNQTRNTVPNLVLSMR